MRWPHRSSARAGAYLVLVFALACGVSAGAAQLDVTSGSVGPDFPDGVVVAMNSSAKHFLLFRWSNIAAQWR
jgi:hypothetical protein